MVNFEQAVSIDPPRVTYVDIQFFSFTAWSGRIVSTFTTSKQYACILRVQYGNESKQLATIPAHTGDKNTK
jgi:hypothetical protein